MQHGHGCESTTNFTYLDSNHGRVVYRRVTCHWHSLRNLPAGEATSFAHITFSLLFLFGHSSVAHSVELTPLEASAASPHGRYPCGLPQYGARNCTFSILGNAQPDDVPLPGYRSANGLGLEHLTIISYWIRELHTPRTVGTLQQQMAWNTSLDSRTATITFLIAAQ